MSSAFFEASVWLLCADRLTTVLPQRPRASGRVALRVARAAARRGQDRRAAPADDGQDRVRHEAVQDLARRYPSGVRRGPMGLAGADPPVDWRHRVALQAGLSLAPALVSRKAHPPHALDIFFRRSPRRPYRGHFPSPRIFPISPRSFPYMISLGFLSARLYFPLSPSLSPASRSAFP